MNCPSDTSGCVSAGGPVRLLERLAPVAAEYASAFSDVLSGRSSLTFPLKTVAITILPSIAGPDTIKECGVRVCLVAASDRHLESACLALDRDAWCCSFGHGSTLSPLSRLVAVQNQSRLSAA
jgi:hypothetical protein